MIEYYAENSQIFIEKIAINIVNLIFIPFYMLNIILIEYL